MVKRKEKKEKKKKCVTLRENRYAETKNVDPAARFGQKLKMLKMFNRNRFLPKNSNIMHLVHFICFSSVCARTHIDVWPCEDDLNQFKIDENNSYYRYSDQFTVNRFMQTRHNSNEIL